MGTATVPMLVMTAVSTAAGIYSSSRQASMAAEDQRARGRQAAAQTKEEEIARLKEFKEQQARNMAVMAAGGLAADSGTLSQISEGNIANLEEDVSGIRASGKATQAYYNRGAKNAKTSGKLGMFTSAVQGATSMYKVYNTDFTTGAGSLTGSTN